MSAQASAQRIPYVPAVWLGSLASIWKHRGYQLRGQWVLCPDGDTATVLQRSFGDAVATLVTAQGSDGWTYYYATQEEADADPVGSRCAAAIGQVLGWTSEAL